MLITYASFGLADYQALENVLIDNPLFCCQIFLKGCHFPFFSIVGNKMAQNQTNTEAVKGSTFAQPLMSKAPPISNSLTKPLKLATGTIFKVFSGSNEQVQDKDGNYVVRAVYKVQSLNSKLLPFATEFEIKIKDQECLLSEQDNVDIMFNSKMVTVAFDGLALWSFNRREGLTTSGIRPLQLSSEQIQKIVGGQAHVQD